MNARLYLILGLMVLVLGFLAGRWFLRTPAPVVAKVLRRAVPVAVIAILVLLTVTARLNALYALIGGVFAALPRLLLLAPLLLGLYRRYRARRSSKPHTRPAGSDSGSGQSSQVEARFVRMSLDHDSGVASGTVLEGRFKGAHLHELTLAQLIELLRECRLHDEESARLVEAFLDRMHADEWRSTWDAKAASDSGAPAAHDMSVEEAFEVLGLQRGANEDEITNAHRRLMQKFHPDRGGGVYLAALINQAKDVLLKARRQVN
ncbi:MAG: DnaJ domain-containing protein [Chromatiales bacterium]|jgi:hypothetical protein|nr:DnaJ domain-containing protein [Chromatiales bacterium]